MPLSATTVTRRIEEIAEDIEIQLLERINSSPWYALQVDESTDIDNKAILLVYVRYIYHEDVHEDLLCALSLSTNTTGAELFKSLDGYMSGHLKWSLCVGICTSYLSEAGFSAVTATKTKQRNKMDISSTLRVSLSPITPRWNRLVAEKQAWGSH